MHWPHPGGGHCPVAGVVAAVGVGGVARGSAALGVPRGGPSRPWVALCPGVWAGPQAALTRRVILFKIRLWRALRSPEKGSAWGGGGTLGSREEDSAMGGVWSGRGRGECGPQPRPSHGRPPLFPGSLSLRVGPTHRPTHRGWWAGSHAGLGNLPGQLGRPPTGGPASEQEARVCAPGPELAGGCGSDRGPLKTG